MSSQLKVVAAGVGGMLGRALINRLSADGAQVTRLVRPSSKGADPNKEVWNPKQGQLNPSVLEGADAVICLNGAGVADRRWTRAYKQELRDSRVVPTKLLVDTMAHLNQKPKMLLMASAVGFYGDRGDTVLDESAEPGTGFLADLSLAWEDAAKAAEDLGVRVVWCRIGVVLAPNGGALAKMLPPFRMGLGGVVGSGKQYMSWISIEDVIASMIFCINNTQVSGPINMTAPEPATNAQFTRALGRALGRPTIFPMPGFVAKGIFGEMGDAILLGGSRVVPRKLQEAGYQFQYPTLEQALSQQIN